MTWVLGYQKWLTEAESLNNAQQIINHFVGTDWKRDSLSAMIGNMRHESSVNPQMYEFGYDWSADRGYGLVQWTPRSKYWNWAESAGLDPEQPESQLKRIDYEVENNIQWIPQDKIENLTFTEFRTNARAWSVEELTSAFTWGYERPLESAGINSMPARIAFALRVFNELDFSGVGVIGPPPPPEKNQKIYHLWLSGVLRW